MSQYNYEVTLKWEEQRKGVLTAPGFSDIEVATPPEFFKGHKDTWTPEHLLASAAASCFMTTFLAVAEYSNLQIVSFEIQTILKLEKVNNGLTFTKLTIKPEITLISDLDTAKAIKAIEKTEIICPVTKSFYFKIEVEPVFEYLNQSEKVDI